MAKNAATRGAPWPRKFSAACRATRACDSVKKRSSVRSDYRCGLRPLQRSCRVAWSEVETGLVAQLARVQLARLALVTSHLAAREARIGHPAAGRIGV